MRNAATLIARIIDVLGEPHRSGQHELTWCCPWCVERGQKRPDTRYRLYVNPQKSLFFCQNCQAKGTVEWMLRRLGVDVQLDALDWTTILERIAALGAPQQRSAADELEQDAVTYPCKVYRVEPGLKSYRYLLSRGLTPKQMFVLHLVVGSGRWRRRIFFPNFGADGRMDFWSARAFDGEYGPKYLTSPGAPRRERLYRYHQILRRVRAGTCKSIVITEGVISAIAAGDDAVATFGKYVTPEQQQLLLDLRKVAPSSLRYLIALDGDAVKFSTDLAHSLRGRGADVSVVQLPQQHDPASLPRATWQALREHPMRYDGLLSGVRMALCGVGY